MSKKKKSPLFMSTMQQGSFYSALKTKEDVEIVSKFNQSGITGFLPIIFPGVCYSMTTDYARAINQGTDKQWLTHVGEKNFTKRLIAGQLRGMAQLQNTELNDELFARTRTDLKTKAAVSLREHANEERIEPASTDEGFEIVEGSEDDRSSIGSVEADDLRSTNSGKDDFDEFSLLDESVAPPINATVMDIASHDIFNNFNSEINKLEKNDTGCIDIPHVRLNLSLVRKGVFKSLAGERLAHTMIFSLARDEEGKLDKEHLTFMDPNCGLFKIKNDEASIKDFLNTFDETMLSQFECISAEPLPVERTWLPPKSNVSAWQEAKDVIKDINSEETSYEPQLHVKDRYDKAADKIYDMMAQFLDKNIQRWGNDSKNEKRNQFISLFQKLTPADLQGDKLDETLGKLETMSSKKRSWHGLFEATSQRSFKELKKEITTLRQESPSPDAPDNTEEERAEADVPSK